ncbi:calcium/proton antiporter [Salmonella enterica subsp. enterica]|nr:calcium/proton antiporter [Salmonella enterica subsp. enterica]
MTHACEAVKTRHKETSLIFPVLALVVLFLWGSSQSLPVVIGINILALIGILSSAFSVVRHADVLAHRLGEPYGSLILSLSVVILEVSLISALMATGRCCANAYARYALLYYYDCHRGTGRFLVVVGRA